MAVCSTQSGDFRIRRAFPVDVSEHGYFNHHGGGVYRPTSLTQCRPRAAGSPPPPPLIMVPSGYVAPALPPMYSPSHEGSNVYNFWGGYSTQAIARALSAGHPGQKRPRSEKKPIPDNQKDDKYFERRVRNNVAAKKSRDHRKAREDEIAIRASFLEKENAILRAQVATLREESNSLRQLLLQKRSRNA